MKMSEYGIDAETSDRSESYMARSKEGPPKTGSKSGERATKSANQKFRRSTRHTNPVIQYGYNEYISHHYAFMVKLATVHEPESLR